jgi:NAD dependent epimerase/dehydratase family enzyme
MAGLLRGAPWGHGAKSRWRRELDNRKPKKELGLGHYEGRHWMRWHHHASWVSAAHVLLRSEQARGTKTPGATRPLVRTSLQVLLMKLVGCCHWCHTRFDDSCWLTT